jgi:hypothetical protein
LRRLEEVRALGARRVDLCRRVSAGVTPPCQAVARLRLGGSAHPGMQDSGTQ